MDQLSEQMRVCEQAVRAAGAVIQDWVGRTSVKHKGPADLVTEADFAAQEKVRQIVLGAYPDHALLGEEGPSGPDTGRKCEYRWIVDPVDGTTNFVHHVPHYAVSLALEQHGKVVLGAVYDPSLDECFSATPARGMAEWAADSCQRGRYVGRCVGGVGLSREVRPDSPDLLVFNQAIYRCQGVRRSGSAAPNCATWPPAVSTCCGDSRPRSGTWPPGC